MASIYEEAKRNARKYAQMVDTGVDPRSYLMETPLDEWVKRGRNAVKLKAFEYENAFDDLDTDGDVITSDAELDFDSLTDVDKLILFRHYGCEAGNPVGQARYGNKNASKWEDVIVNIIKDDKYGMTSREYYTKCETFGVPRRTAERYWKRIKELRKEK